MVWWRSPASATDSLVTSGQLLDIPIAERPENSGGTRQTACIDTEPSTFTIQTYAPSSGTTQTHSHMITQNVVGDPQTDFTGGGQSGPGIIGAPYGSGLTQNPDVEGQGFPIGASLQVEFDQSELFMDMTDAEFKFSSAFKKPTPDVTMRPQRKVPIINPFHKTKYIIKAF